MLLFNCKNINELLNHKEKLPTGLNPGLVYHLTEKTKKCMKTRAGEHFRISPPTGSLLVRPPQSSMKDHIEIYGSSKLINHYSCFNTPNNSVLLRIRESLEMSIKKKKKKKKKKKNMNWI